MPTYFEGKILTISTYFTNLAISMVPGNQDMKASRIFSTIPMGSRKMKYFTWDSADWNRPEGKELSNREPPPVADFGAPTEQEVKARKWGVATNWTDEELAEAEDGPGGAAGYLRRKVGFVTRQALLRRELDVINLIRQTAWTTVLVSDPAGPPAGGSGQFLVWDDDDAEPIKLMRYIIRDMEFRTGKKPNIAVIPGVVLDVLFEHPAFLDRIIGGATTDRPASVSLALLTNMLGLDEIIEVSSVINTAKEGEPANNVWAWDRDVWIGYRPSGDAIDPEAPAPAYLFNWTGKNGAKPTPFQGAANNEGIFINRFTSQRPAVYWAESYLYSIPKVVAKDLGVLLKNVVATRAPL
ncbi:major capsid protein [Caulobacter phage Sansa]|uniref:Major capsid protein n=1 Tax=Caulobacter phage Sansa TaxID=1675600 RepID=A0A0K1LLR3_9CAUD|nr:major head protein [Caulobacter phage Sansa]AKU43431.1 major capsid protein [Caulobacter phage Sansa]